MVTTVTHYSVSATYKGVTWTAGPSTSNYFTLPNTRSFTNRFGGTQNIGYITFGSAQGFPMDAGHSGGGVKNGPYAVTAGTQLHGATAVNYFNDVDYYKFNALYRCTVSGSSSITYEGNRIVTVKCSTGGGVTSPSIAGGASIVAYTGAAGDITAHTNFLTVTAGDGAASTGTLTKRGYTAGTWDKWTWDSSVLSTATAATTKTIAFSLRAGYDDTTLTANFTRSSNSASTWSPKLANVVIHLLDSNLDETESSVNSVGSSTQWTTFRNKAFTAFSCASGGTTRTWTSTYTDTVYLMNVPDATFAVTPKTGMRVYGWELVDADDVVIDTFGSGNTALISGFAEGCKVHLYLTSASPNPRIIYDGFDTEEMVPDNENVLVAGASFPVAYVWTSSSLDPITVTLSPTAWATRGLGQERSVIIDSGTPLPLANVAGTGATIVSSAAQYSLTHVQFRQAAEATTGVLTLTVTEDTITPLTSIGVRVFQEETLLDTLTGSDTVDYYAGSGSLGIVVDVNYGAQDPSDFVVTVKPAVVYDGDGADGTSLDAKATTRAVTVFVTQVVNFGALSVVAINLTRDTSVGTLISGATSAGPTTQCSAGSITVTMAEGQSSATPIYVECSANAGYILKSIRVVDAATGTKTFYAGPAPTAITPIYANLPQVDDDADIKVILVMAAVIVGTPAIKSMLPDDLGKFAATITSVGGYSDFRVGDSVLLTAVPVGGTAVAIGIPTFNDAAIVPVRDGTSITATAILSSGANVFKVPAYVVFETAASPTGAGTIALSTAWAVEDTLVISAVTYRRIGSAFTVTAPLTSTSPSTYTLVSSSLGRRATTTPYDYVEVGVIAPVVVGDTTRTFTGTLRGPSILTAVYAIGNLHPTMAFAAFDYAADAYITSGVRPSVTTTPVSPATLSDNIVDTVAWPSDVGETPGDEYEGATFLVRSVTSNPLLPQVNILITSSVSARLEVWNQTTGLWFQYSPVAATLSEDFTFFRVAVGDPPENQVTVTFEAAEDADAVAIAGCSVYATSGTTYDGTFKLPATMTVISRIVLHARVTPPAGYIVIGWYIDTVLYSHGASLSVVVPDTGLTLKPLLELRSFAASSVMVLNADPNLTDEGIWVSKLFRAQEPWKPLTATVVAKPPENPVMLAVMKDGGDAPTELDTENPGTVAITVVGDSMRRLPPGQIQKTRFVRYMVVLSGKVSISSVAVGSGAFTMKGGH